MVLQDKYISYNTILKSVFPIAIHLAHGNRIALAPAVWAPFQMVQIWALER